MTDLVPATDVRTCHGYDTLDHLTHSYTTTAASCDHNDTTTAAGNAGYNKSWTYTVDGNIATACDGASTRSYGYTDTAHPHAVTSTTTTAGTTYGYAADGAMTTRTTGAGSGTLGWDPVGHLAIATTGAATTTFVHAVDGTRLARVTPGGTATLYAAGEEVDIAGGAITATRRYYSLAGDTVAVRTAAGLTWQVNDRQNSTDLQVADGSTTANRAYTDPFGKPRTPTPPVTLVGDRGFLNKTTDPSTGLTQLGDRYYDTDLGRFISADGLNDQRSTQTPNPYTYSANNPVAYSDPSGFKLCSDSCQRGDPWIPSTGGPIRTPGPACSCGQPLHGIGCLFDLATGETVDLDWDQDGQPIFNVYRLQSYARSIGRRGHWTDEQLRDAAEWFVSAGELRAARQDWFGLVGADSESEPGHSG